MKKSDLFFIFKSYLIWIVCLFAIVFLSTKILPVKPNYLGGDLGNYQTNPFLWVWGNFDGVHYLSIAENGYEPLTYFFFPLYPIVTSIFSVFFGSEVISFLKSGIFVSNISFIVALVGLYKLLKLDFKENVIRNSIILLLIFPTSYYCASVYTESLFLALAVWSIYFIRLKKWPLVGILGGLASATRVIGIIIFAMAILEYFEFRLPFIFQKKIKKDILWLLLIPLCLLVYVCFVWLKTGDPLNFVNSIVIFGAQRSNNLIILPQVFYRYIFKILPNVNYRVLISFFPTVLEFATGLIFLGLGILAFWKMRFSYAIYLVFGYLVPTLSGSFSSLPRYVLVLFPAFVLAAKYLGKYKHILFAFYLLSFILLVVSFSLFARGYWIS